MQDRVIGSCQGASVPYISPHETFVYRLVPVQLLCLAHTWSLPGAPFFCRLLSGAHERNSLGKSGQRNVRSENWKSAIFGTSFLYPHGLSDQTLHMSLNPTLSTCTPAVTVERRPWSNTRIHDGPLHTSSISSSACLLVLPCFSLSFILHLRGDYNHARIIPERH